MSKATDNLRDHQQQLDEDGVTVGVSRQALDETLSDIERYRRGIVNALEYLEAQEPRVGDATFILNALMA